MKLNDMTLCDIDCAARHNSQQYEPHYKGCAKSAFIEGACWAYEYLTKEGQNVPAWCDQNANKKDVIITPGLLKKNGWKASPNEQMFLHAMELNGIHVYFEYNIVNKALFYMDSIIPYPVERLSQLRRFFEVMGCFKIWEL